MALTWHGFSTSALPPNYRRATLEAGIDYHFARARGRFEYGVKMPDRAAFNSTVETIVGGKRHGLSFLTRISAIDGLPLAAAPLIETRYLHYSPSDRLVMSPGFPEQPPTTWETAIGRVLSPEFEQKCLNCHGAPRKESHETGVRCETCHGPGSAHAKSPAVKIAKPDMATCAECHSGFSDIQDPVPADLLISNQVNALKRSQCYIQSGGNVTCAACHDPHRDATGKDTKATAACLACHAPKAAGRAALCPIDKTGECIGCHMPQVEKGSFHMADHWIRVHPEQGLKATRRDPADRTHVEPKRLYLRWIVAGDRQRAAAANAELASGAPFFDVARKYSTDNSALSGGFLGDMAVADLDPALASAAVRIGRGQYSDIVESKGKPVIVYRMPRDFLYYAEQLDREAARLREKRMFAEAVAKYVESLQIYPYFLRSLIFMGVSLGEQGDAARAAGVLELAAQLYPKDPAAFYNLGIAYGALGRADDEARAYRRALDLEPDLVPAYMNLGGALYAAGRLDEAADVYQRGLKQNPLSATLYFNLARVYERQGKTAEAQRAAAVAAKIDPHFAKAGS